MFDTFSKKEVAGIAAAVALALGIGGYTANAMYQTYTRCDVGLAECGLNGANGLTRFYAAGYLKITEPLSVTSRTSKIEIRLQKLENDAREQLLDARELSLASLGDLLHQREQVLVSVADEMAKQQTFGLRLALKQAEDDAAKLREADKTLTADATASYDGEHLVSIVVVKDAGGNVKQLARPFLGGNWGEQANQAPSGWPPVSMMSSQ